MVPGSSSRIDFSSHLTDRIFHSSSFLVFSATSFMLNFPLTSCNLASTIPNALERCDPKKENLIFIADVLPLFFFSQHLITYLCWWWCHSLCDAIDCSPPGLSVGFPREGYWSGLPFPSLLQGIFPTQGLNPHLLLWQADSLPPSHQGSPTYLPQHQTLAKAR